MSKVYTIPEWFTKLKAYKKYDLEKAYSNFEKSSNKALEKVSKKKFNKIIKNCKKERFPYSDDELENIAYIDEHLTSYSDSLLDLKISYLEKIYEKENTRQDSIDQKAWSNIGQTSLVIGLTGVLGAGGVFEIVKHTTMLLKILFFIITGLLILFYCLSFYFSVNALKPRSYTRPRQDLMHYGINNDLRVQKIGYFISFYISQYHGIKE